jgi:hypothetical protein
VPRCAPRWCVSEPDRTQYARHQRYRVHAIRHWLLATLGVLLSLFVLLKFIVPALLD